MYISLEILAKPHKCSISSISIKRILRTTKRTCRTRLIIVALFFKLAVLGWYTMTNQNFWTQNILTLPLEYD